MGAVLRCEHFIRGYLAATTAIVVYAAILLESLAKQVCDSNVGADRNFLHSCLYWHNWGRRRVRKLVDNFSRLTEDIIQHGFRQFSRLSVLLAGVIRADDGYSVRQSNLHSVSEGSQGRWVFPSELF